MKIRMLMITTVKNYKRLIGRIRAADEKVQRVTKQLELYRADAREDRPLFELSLRSCIHSFMGSIVNISFGDNSDNGSRLDCLTSIKLESDHIEINGRINSADGRGMLKHLYPAMETAEFMEEHQKKAFANIEASKDDIYCLSIKTGDEKWNIMAHGFGKIEKPTVMADHDVLTYSLILPNITSTRIDRNR